MKGIVSYFRAHTHRLATVALIFGFFVDIVTFRTLNLTYALMLLAVHLVIVAAATLILSAPSKGEATSATLKFRPWIEVAQQYSTGNLLSAFLILYASSGSLAASWPFLFLVAAAAVGNEAVKLDRYRLPFQTTLLFLNLLLYVALLLPVLLSSISGITFFLSLAVGAVIFNAYRLLLRLVAKEHVAKSAMLMRRAAAGVLIALGVLYAANIIPPIPLSLKNVSFYHAVERHGTAYVATDEERLFGGFFDVLGTTLHLFAGEDAYVYTAVFAPARLGTDVVHRWERYDQSLGRWVTQNKVSFPIIGGRAEGYRGFSFTENPMPGRWRVSVETARGQIIGRSYLLVVHSSHITETVERELK